MSFALSGDTWLPKRGQDGDESLVNAPPPRFPVAKFLWDAKMFEFPNHPSIGRNGKVDEIVGALLLYRDGLRRNFMSDFVAGTMAKAPDCYSLDGRGGSRAETIMNLPNKDGIVSPRSVFGDNCRSCWFSGFNTRDAYKGNPRPGQQCSQYALAFMILGADKDMESGLPIVLQVPPMGTRITEDFHEMASTRNTVASAFIWRIMGEGGGRKQNQMKASACGVLSETGFGKLMEYRKKYSDVMEVMVNNFVALGKDLSYEGDNNKTVASIPNDEGSML